MSTAKYAIWAPGVGYRTTAPLKACGLRFSHGVGYNTRLFDRVSGEGSVAQALVDGEGCDLENVEIRMFVVADVPTFKDIGTL